MRKSASQYDKYVDLVQRYEAEYKNSSTGAAYDRTEFPKRFVIAPKRSFTPPDWSVILTRRPPAMGENDYVDFIKKQSEADYAAEKYYSSNGHYILLQSYIQCVSPDRIKIYEESIRHTGGRMNATFKYFDDYGHTVLRWNPFFDVWEAVMTSLEKARIEIYKGIYLGTWQRLKKGIKKPRTSSKLDIRG